MDWLSSASCRYFLLVNASSFGVTHNGIVKQGCNSCSLIISMHPHSCTNKRELRTLYSVFCTVSMASSCLLMTLFRYLTEPKWRPFNLYLLLVIVLTAIRWASSSQVWLIQLYRILIHAFFVDQWKLFSVSHSNRGMVPGFFVAMIESFAITGPIFR